ncbi:hypothetical protein [Hasllibacter sp. MH4015]|uniref:hypothetical protein n=1 Tax=Hasllibacter sp. MH4015 TaxID=2854029 RepID=UPI001CD3E0E4|nr:hypothetical protein [Hasllibacter sp. MH4015]
MAALLVSGIQAFRSARSDTKNRRSVQFIEVISVQFADCEASLDLLEAKLRKSLVHPEISSAEILEFALPAGRKASRAMRSVSEMPAVQLDLIAQTRVDELDAIWQMASEDEFSESTRALAIKTALNIVTRVSANLSSAKSTILAKHL